MNRFSAHKPILSFARSTPRQKQLLDLAIRVLLIVLLLLAWELMVRSGWLSSFYISYPSEIILDLWEYIPPIHEGKSLTLQPAGTLPEAGTISAKSLVKKRP